MQGRLHGGRGAGMCSSQKRKQPFRGVALRYALIKCNSVWGGGGATTRNSIRAKFCKFRGCMGRAWPSRRAGNKKALARLRPRTFSPQLANAPSSRAERTHHIAPRQAGALPVRCQVAFASCATSPGRSVDKIVHWSLAARIERKNGILRGGGKKPTCSPDQQRCSTGPSREMGAGRAERA